MPSSREDVTFYVPFGQLAELDARLAERRSGANQTPSERSPEKARECNLQFRWDGSDEVLSGRGIVCSCFDGQWLSVTVRIGERSIGSGQAADMAEPVRWPKDPIPKPISADLTLAAWPAVVGGSMPKPPNQVLDTVEMFLDCLTRASEDAPRSSPNLSGLIVVSGRTGSGKSSYVRELAREYVQIFFERGRQQQRGGDVERPPHVVTFEDPVEQWFSSPRKAQECGFDYTPRQKGVDASRLSDVLRDALRQTPAVLFVGETRDERDWKALISFAGTGHLAFTTTHAGSLTETMGHILRATEAETPAERSEIARRIHSLIHLRRDDKTGRRVPALWRSTTSSVNAMTAEGLGSILPHTPARKMEAQSSFGRAYFVRKLPDPNEDGLLERAIAWDLAGE